MRKQTDYEFRLMRVSAIDPTASRDELSKVVKEYLSAGWELQRAETVTYAGNEAFIAYHFIKWEEVSDEVRAKK